MAKFVLVEVGNEREPIRAFDNGKDAADQMRVYNDNAREFGSSCRYRVLRIEGNSEPEWHTRERARFDDGTYKPVPWHNEPWVKRDHFVHVSARDAGKLAFTKSNDNGERDIQTAMRPGRYLSLYHADLGQDAIRDWCGRFDIENSDIVLRFATTPDEIEAVYTNGPNSCMSHGPRDYDSDEHPTRVYGAGDLAIAYIGDPEDEVTARALCWPEKKIFGRIYGDESRLADLLENAGFREARRDMRDWYGARLLRIPQDGGFIVPYLDHPCHAVDDDGQYLILGGSEINCRNTHGLSDAEECCACCGEYYSVNHDWYTVDGEQWCTYCVSDNSYWCKWCYECHSGSPHMIVGELRMCEGAEQQYSCCHQCDEWHHNDNIVSDLNGETWCQHCADRYLVETPCGEYADSEDACDCHHCTRHRAEAEGEADSDDTHCTFRPVRLKPTSPTIDDYRQTSLFHLHEWSW